MHGRLVVGLVLAVFVVGCGVPIDETEGEVGLKTEPVLAGPSGSCVEVPVASDACLDADTFKLKMQGACNAMGLENTNGLNLVSCAPNHYKSGTAVCCKRPPPPPPSPVCFAGEVLGPLCIGESKLKQRAWDKCQSAGATLTDISYVRTGCVGIDAVSARYLCCQ